MAQDHKHYAQLRDSNVNRPGLALKEAIMAFVEYRYERPGPEASTAS
jgi:hypothetical protein